MSGMPLFGRTSNEHAIPRFAFLALRAENRAGDAAMPAKQPRYSKEEFARRGDAIYDRDISPKLPPEAHGKFVALDIETGDFEIDEDELAACHRLDARIPNAQTWLKRVGYRHTRRFGGILRRTSS